MSSIFTSIVKKRERRSNFDLSHDVKLSLDMGELVPITVIDCIPGDNFSISTSQMLRLAPLVSPVMHRIDVFTEYFFVPNRILWPNWETFITGSRNGKQVPPEEAPAFPVVRPFDPEIFLNENGSLSDYMGIPTPSSFPEEEELNENVQISALPFAAYQLIWDEYYRDENLMESMYDVLDGQLENYNQLPDGTLPDEVQQQLSTMRTRAWEHDYFTSALPWAQKGEVIAIPVELGFDKTLGVTRAQFTGPDEDFYFDGNMEISATQYPGMIVAPRELDPNPDARYQVAIDNSSQLTNTTTINDLRAAIKLQEWLETNARGGSRYFESIYAHFGVKSPDSRLSRPEFIGSSRGNMVISEVLQTSSPQGEDDTPQGNMSGHGQSVGTSKRFKYYCQEHGYIIGILSVLPKTAYMQGIPRHFLKRMDKLEYYFPEFAHLGEQEIENIEIYAGGLDGSNLFNTFGYTPRYAEYKFMNSRVAGDFRDTLKFWHMGRIFENTPQLNDTFILSNPTKRIFAVQDLPNDGSGLPEGVRDYHSIYAHVFHKITASRLMPKYGTPSTGGNI